MVQLKGLGTINLPKSTNYVTLVSLNRYFLLINCMDSTVVIFCISESTNNIQNQHIQNIICCIFFIKKIYFE